MRAAVILSVLAFNAPVFAQQPLEGLSPAQQAFIDNPANLNLFGLSKETLIKRLEGLEPEDQASTITAMMETLEKRPYQGVEPIERDIDEPLEPAGDYASVPLNTKAGSYNAGIVLRPAELDDYQRTPGIFSVKRYLKETDGIPTFANAPVAVRAADLVASKVDVAFMGVPMNLGSGWRDSQHAPHAMRAMYGLSGYDVYAGIDPAETLVLADFGNISADRLSIDTSIGHIKDMVGEILGAGTVPFIIGGDHSIVYPSVEAVADAVGEDKLTMVHLDAHANAALELAHPLVDRNVVSALVKNDILEGGDLVQVGLRGQDLSSETFTWLRGEGVRYHTMAEVEERGWDRVMKAALSEAKTGDKKTFIAFDMSILDPSEGKGAGRPAAGGLTMREVLPFMRRLCAETPVAGFAILDVNPYLDLSYQTPLNANSVMHACLTGMALRAKGVREEDYLSDLTRRD
ncbi:MAG: agmatinase family protein [Pseudomonadota bacterium]